MTVKFNPKMVKDVREFINKIEEAHQKADNSNLQFRSLKS